MRRKRIPVTVLAAALSACVVESELLNSERIERRFGSYGIEILSSKDGVRRSSLHSIEGEQKICRTYAVVRFENVPDSIVGEEHAQILAGHSIGEIFKTRGWQIFKETRLVGEYQPPSTGHPVLHLMALDDAPPLAMHVYRLLLKKDGQIIDYATIIEVHHPEYLDRDALQELFVVEEPAGLGEADIKAATALVGDTAW